MRSKFLTDCVYRHTRVSYWSCISSGNKPASTPCRWERRNFPLGLKGLVREADHSPASNAEVENEWRCTSTPPYDFMSCTGTTTFIAAGIVTRIRVGWPRIGGSILVKGKKYFCSPQYTARLWSVHSPSTLGVGVSLPEVQAADCRC